MKFDLIEIAAFIVMAFAAGGCVGVEIHRVFGGTFNPGGCKCRLLPACNHQMIRAVDVESR